ncbi:hypothetical protein [Endozoicomonas sp. G2_1]|uniref:hypothetical protein n=1 Tax=Endozoicomonas sp. G2_1 TaxID=2821091 RepID=UPI001FFDFA8A|nr:hypothetical protein [Endozoicomonas sp. G2_1]
MSIIARLLSQWPENLVALHKSQYFCQSAFYQETRHKWPYWLHQVMRTKLSKEYCHVSEDEITQAIKLLIKMGYAPSQPNIGEILGKDRSFKIPKRLKSKFASQVKQETHLMRVFSWKN